MAVLTFENAKIFRPFSNFAGKPDKFHPQGGYRQFCLLLDDETGEKLQKEHWNVRQLMPRDDGDTPTPYISVRINFHQFNGELSPKVIQITSGGRTRLTEETIGKLDWAEIENVDLSINSRNWEYGKRSGVNGYLRSMYVTLHEDPLDLKYAAVPSENDIPVPFDED